MPAGEPGHELIVFTRCVEIRQVRRVRNQHLFGRRQRIAQRGTGATPGFRVARAVHDEHRHADGVQQLTIDGLARQAVGQSGHVPG